MWFGELQWTENTQQGGDKCDVNVNCRALAELTKVDGHAYWRT
jgi:hypothetical protein